MAEGRFESVSGEIKLPRWLAITASVAGMLMFGMGMSRIVRPFPLRDALLPMLTGSVMVYISGFEKQLVLDGEGVYQKRAFWGRKKERAVSWDNISDASVILNKGKNIYVLLRGEDKIPPFTLKREEGEGVIKLLAEKLTADKIQVEK